MTGKQIKEQAARCAKFVEWSDEDKCFIGRCPELMLCGVHGKEEAKVYAELCAAVEEMIEVIHADGKEMPQSHAWANVECRMPNAECGIAEQTHPRPTLS